MSTGEGTIGPTRIELASSELEGGSTIAWVDPQQVLACVAHVDSRESFTRFLEPRLAQIDSPTTEPENDGARPLPPRVRCLLERLRHAHTRLVRENRAAPDARRVIWPVVASVEEGTVYFLKAAPCWVFRVRNDVSELIRSGGEVGQAASMEAGFGQSPRLQLAVTSVEVQPNDVVVLLVSRGGTTPDRLAVSGVFKDKQDLKRACDSLVNLFSFASDGVAAVAMRFVPVGARGDSNSEGIDLLEDLERELFSGLSVAGGATQPPAPEKADRTAQDRSTLGLDEFVLPAFLEEAGKPFGAKSGEGPGVHPPSPPAGRRTEPTRPEPVGHRTEPTSPDAVGRRTEPTSPDAVGHRTEPTSPEPVAPLTTPSRPSYTEATPTLPEPIVEAVPIAGPQRAPSASARNSENTDRALVPPAESDRLAPSPGGRPTHKRKVLTPWTAALATVIVTLLAVVGVPRGVRLLRGEGGVADGGVIRVDPTPPARAIFIDGVDQETGSPAILEGVTPGVRRVRLDLGAFGSMEMKVRVRTGETVDLHPKATGSLEISAIEERAGASVWLSGRQRLSLPCRIDSLPAGWQEVLYEDDRVPLWQRQVLVLAGGTATLRINNSFATDQALLRVESWSYRKGEGMQASDGDTVYVDRRYFGVTPIEREVPPGLHGICVVGSEGSSWTEVLDLTPGSSRVVAPRFGLETWPRIEHQEPGRILLRGSVPLTATFSSPDGTPPRNPRLHLPGLDATVRDLPLSPVDPERGVYVGIVDPRWIPMNRGVAYYFTVQTTDGQTLCSELYRLTAVGEISQALQP